MFNVTLPTNETMVKMSSGGGRELSWLQCLFDNNASGDNVGGEHGSPTHLS